jgi:5-methylcytosine-specific restriction endonuclease McrA
MSSCCYRSCSNPQESAIKATDLLRKAGHVFSRKCSEPRCRNNAYRRGLCRRHYDEQPRGSECQWPGCWQVVRTGASFCVPHAKKAWKLRNPEKVQQHEDTRRAREKNVFSESISRARVWKRDRGRCGICGRKADPGNWHLDHVIPLSKGGTHTYGNVQVSHPRCNQEKGAKILAA